MKSKIKQILLFGVVSSFCSSCFFDFLKKEKDGPAAIPSFDLCDPAVRDFLETYDADKEYDILKNRAQPSCGYQFIDLDIPNNISNSFVYYDTDPNFSNPYFYSPDYGNNTLALPGQKYYYRVYSLKGDDEDRLYTYDLDFIKSMPTKSELIKEGSFTTKGGGVRFCNISGLSNLRDLGGWKTTDGKVVKYNKLFRGPAVDSLNKTAEIELKGQLGIKTEIDLRYGTSLTSSCFAENFLYAGIQAYDSINPNKIGYGSYNKKSIQDIFSYLGNENNYPMYYHCAVGCDRTGTLSFLINGALGVPLKDLTKDFELSSFSNYGYRCRGPLSLPYRYGMFQNDSQNYVNWGALSSLVINVDKTGTLPFKECVIKFLVDNYEVPLSDIESMQRIMLGD